MDNLKTRETFWFTENAKEISRDLAEGNADAERAMFLVFSRIDGVRAYKDVQTDLSPEEWAKLYGLCGDSADMLISSLVVMNCLNDMNHIHENLQLQYPAPFVVKPIQEGEILVGGRNVYAMRRHFREEFLHRLKTAKRSQPKA